MRILGFKSGYSVNDLFFFFWVRKENSRKLFSRELFLECQWRESHRISETESLLNRSSVINDVFH